MQAAQGVHHYENFPVASLLCPARLKPCVIAIYGFARTADDIADEGQASAAERLADLAAYRADLNACAAGEAPSSRWAEIFTPLGRQIAQHKLPVYLLDDLLKAFEMDVQRTASGDWMADHGELLQYCQLSANPVGRLLLHLYGLHDKTALEESDAICSALQLINFWQDVGRDAQNQRYYLPMDLMAKHNVTQAQIKSLQDNPATRKLIAACAVLALASMLKGMLLPARVRSQMGGFDGWRASLELRCVVQGGLRIVEKIKAQGCNTLSQRPKLSAWDGALVLWRALRMRG